MEVEVQLRPVADLEPYERNARVHKPEAIERLAKIIEDMGWTNPILCDADGIVAGHKRRLAALAIYERGGTIKLPGGRALPDGMVPVIDVSGWTEAQRRAYILADNQTTLESEWDVGALRFELKWLDDAGFDMGLTGFDTNALAQALAPPPAPDPQAEAAILRVSLADRFGIPPFSVMSAREGWWQERKRAWLALGIKSELGRGQGGINDAAPGGSARPLDRMRAKKANATPGGSMPPAAYSESGERIVGKENINKGRRRKPNAAPGGQPLPATSYGKTKARGDGRGRPIKGNQSA